MATILALRDVSKLFRQGKEVVTVLSHASYTFQQGTTYALLGISGTGKSTVLQLLAGLERPTHGAIACNEKLLAHATKAEQRSFLHETVGTVFQMPYLIDELSVVENIMLKGLVAGLEQTFVQQQAHELLEKIKLTHKAHVSPASLSGGEQQRVALARALFMQPTFLLADEPTAHLDGETKKEILQLILDLKQNSGMGVVIATHDPEVAALLDIKVRIVDGKLITES